MAFQTRNGSALTPLRQSVSNRSPEIDELVEKPDNGAPPRGERFVVNGAPLMGRALAMHRLQVNATRF